MFKFGHGDQVKDSITGFKGTVTGRHDYITGCKQYSVTPGIKKDGTLADGNYFDEDRLSLAKGRKKTIKKTMVAGPQDHPDKT